MGCSTNQVFKEGQGYVTCPDKVAASFAKGSVVDGVYRWGSNGSCPFDDMMEDFVAFGHTTQAVREATAEARDADTLEFLKNYKAPKPTAEMMFEMRAAFGEGETVVDFITGKEYHT